MATSMGVLLLCVQVDDVVHERCAAGVDVANEVAQSAFAVELLCAYALNAHLGIFLQAHVCQRDGDAGIQVGQFAHAVGQCVVLVGGGDEDAAIGPELLARTADVRFADDLHACYGFAFGILLTINFAVTVHL